MLKRVCDRCGAEIPVEQMMEQDELILRRLNDKPYDLCPECQAVLQKWFMPMLQKGINKKRCDCYHDENGQPCCWGTREKDPCDCAGDERRCTHYPEKRGER